MVQTVFDHILGRFSIPSGMDVKVRTIYLSMPVLKIIMFYLLPQPTPTPSKKSTVHLCRLSP